MNIEPFNSGLTIKIEIEPATRAALGKMTEPQRDDWFSFHCPNEHHPVWADSTNDFDITVEDILHLKSKQPISPSNIGSAEELQYKLSCVAYIKAQYDRRLSYAERVRLKLEKLLNR